MIYLKEMEINIMAIDATFWVAVSFVIFFGGLIYLKVPQKINEIHGHKYAYIFKRN